MSPAPTERRAPSKAAWFKVDWFNAHVPWPIRGLIVLILGVMFWALTIGMVPGVLAKTSGKAPDCTWPSMLAVPFQHLAWTAASQYYSWSVKVEEQDPKLDLQLVSSPHRSFWIQGQGSRLGGKALLAYLLTEHTQMGSVNPSHRVQPGDIVLDCGAHVGVFTWDALRRGAAKVVAIEPDPLNLECLRRNFKDEIAAGRVIVFSKGVWSEEKTLVLFTGAENSGMNSMLQDQGAGKIEVPVTTIDRMVAQLGLPRVSYIKMDIEGAEREALKGAIDTMRRFRPRIMLDSYHRADDLQALPPLIRAAHPDYRLACGPCQPLSLQSDLFVPHVTYYQ
jgi:FkbM family methyltransferase